jgi:hypothetical protein
MSLPFVKKIRMWSSAVAIAAGMGIAVDAQAQAQTSTAQTAPAMPAKYVVRNTVFHLPFKIGQKAQANVREMHLWMRDDSGQWKLADRVPPSASYFTCRVPHDGEYGFSIVTVDRRGLATPRNVTSRLPELLVVVESRPQSARPAAPAGVVPGIMENAVPLETPAVRMSGSQSASGQPSGGMTEAIVPVSPIQQAPASQPLRTITETIVPVAEPGPLTLDANHVPGVRAGTGMTIVNQPSAPAPAPATITPEITEQAGSEEEIPGATAVSTSDRTVKGQVVLLVNNAHVSVEYNVGKSGPSGLAKVLIYGTTDQGRTWECLGEDADHHSPAEITLPGEGTYGIRMVGINGNGFGGKAPAAGEQPATTIEVDLTKPKIQGWKVGLAKNGHLDIRWKVSDKNLGNQPISLFYRTGRTGAWKPLAAKIKNEGSFRWSISRDLAPQYYIRLEATDLAGNMASCETQSPILVDRTEPDINVTGVTVIQTRPLEPAHNLVPASGETHDEDE